MRPDTVGSDGDRPMLIRAVVHARLLGLRLLTLDARVVVADLETDAIDLVETIDVERAVTPVGREEPPPPASAVTGSGTDRTNSVAGLDGGVTRARELLAQGAATLASTRR